MCWFQNKPRRDVVTYPVAFCIVVSRKWVKGSQLHPSSAEFFCGVSQKSTDVGPYLQDRVVLTHCRHSTLHRTSHFVHQSMSIAHIDSMFFFFLSRHPLKCLTLQVWSFFLSVHIIIILCFQLPSFPHLPTLNIRIVHFQNLFWWPGLLFFINSLQEVFITNN